MKLEYTALTKNNKKITGALDADSKEAAQEELHKMGLAIIDVKEISDVEYENIQKKQESTKAEKGIKTFSFNGIDGNGKEVDGTIDSLDDFSAYKRLRTEYGLKINKLYSATATDGEKLKAEETLSTFEKKLKNNEGQENEVTQKDNDLRAKNEEIEKKFVAEINNIIIHTKKVLETSKDLFSNISVQNIQNTLEELEKIRSSSNIARVKELSEHLYELISNPDAQDANTNENEKYDSIINELKTTTAENKEDEIYNKAVGLSGIKSIFKNITNKFKTLGKAQISGEPKESIINKIKTQISNLFARFKKKDATIVNTADTAKVPDDAVGERHLSEGAMAKADAYPKDEQINDEPTDTATTSDDDVGTGLDLSDNEKMDIAPVDKSTEKEQPKKIGYITYILTEIDSFISWLLCFYIIYFFLVSFALEKNIGLSSEFVIKTFKTPLILNITILLLIFHLALRIKSLYLRSNIIASLFLLFLSVGTYIILIVNF